MTSESHILHQDDPRDPALDEAFDILAHQAQAPPRFAARVLARVAQQRSRSWSTRLVLPILATSLLLSLGLNFWWGPLALQMRSFLTAFQLDLPSVRSLSTEEPDDIARKNLEAYKDLFERNSVEEWLCKLAALSYEREQFLLVVDAVTAALALGDCNGTAYRLRGAAYDAMEDTTRAIQDMQRAANLGDQQARDIMQGWEGKSP